MAFGVFLETSIWVDIKGCSKDKEFKKEYLKKSTCTAIFINDGVVKRIDDASKVGQIDHTYEVS